MEEFKMKKRFLAGVLAGVLAVGALTACGSSNPQSSTAAQTEAGAETARSGAEAAGRSPRAGKVGNLLLRGDRSRYAGLLRRYC